MSWRWGTVTGIGPPQTIDLAHACKGWRPKPLTAEQRRDLPVHGARTTAPHIAALTDGLFNETERQSR
jgi:hypothetical protein